MKDKLKQTIKLIIFILIVGILLFTMGYFIKQDIKYDNSLYHIKTNGDYYKTKEIKYLPDNRLEFYDVRSKRQVIINDKYIIFNPKTK
jgi:uncharacterized protein YxeA